MVISGRLGLLLGFLVCAMGASTALAVGLLDPGFSLLSKRPTAVRKPVLPPVPVVQEKFLLPKPENIPDDPPAEENVADQGVKQPNELPERELPGEGNDFADRGWRKIIGVKNIPLPPAQPTPILREVERLAGVQRMGSFIFVHPAQAGRMNQARANGSGGAPISFQMPAGFSNNANFEGTRRCTTCGNR